MENTKPSLQKVHDLVKEGRYEEALKVVWKVLVNEPENIDALFYSGGCYFRLGDYANARRHWERLLSARPDHEKARAMLAKIDSMESSVSIAEAEAELRSTSSAGSPEVSDETPEPSDAVTQETPVPPMQPTHKSANLKYCPGCGKESTFSVVPPPAWLTTVLGQHGHKTWRMKWRCQVCGHIKEEGIG